jgi:hypothetical protein
MPIAPCASGRAVKGLSLDGRMDPRRKRSLLSRIVELDEEGQVEAADHQSA